ncbi:hypothetical protein CEXT_261241 [Caerostris extrusa]|uniref:Uncharacterized protein n=1 Tax=Caerostris extrusa TaxID=172846 RepID=A0AAV4U0F4_CAEEX|nr:hypothetical protein CEXT_261241 [Caerostris extrusa]
MRHCNQRVSEKCDLLTVGLIWRLLPLTSVTHGNKYSSSDVSVYVWVLLCRFLTEMAPSYDNEGQGSQVGGWMNGLKLTVY